MKAQIKRLSTRKMWLIAAVIALTLLLVGCAVAYANGWFQQIFSARSETPLSSEQIQYIQKNEQIVGQTQTINDWTIDLKSTICDGRTGYLVFQITAPDDMDLEQYLNPPTVDDKRLSMGNDSASRKAAYLLCRNTTGNQLSLSSCSTGCLQREKEHGSEQSAALQNHCGYAAVECQLLLPGAGSNHV